MELLVQYKCKKKTNNNKKQTFGIRHFRPTPLWMIHTTLHGVSLTQFIQMMMSLHKNVYQL